MTPRPPAGDRSRARDKVRDWTGAAPAKVNLRLDVLDREPSGYHRIETVFQRLELADRVELEVDPEGGSPGDIRLEVTGVEAGQLGPAEKNLAVRAARRFVEAAGDGAPSPDAPGVGDTTVSIRLEKRIPHGAGLGGGSSDAAAVLRGLNELAGGHFSPEELMELGGELGADVPFFVSGAVRALGTGRGDRIEPLPPLPVRTILLAVPETGISTAWAYGLLAEARAAGSASGPAREGVSTPARSPGDEAWATVEKEARNDFEAVLFPRRPELERLKAAFLRGGTGRDGARRDGAGLALLSGSGSVVFAAFADEGAAERAQESVRRIEGVRDVIATKTASRP